MQVIVSQIVQVSDFLKYPLEKLKGKETWEILLDPFFQQEIKSQSETAIDLVANPTSVSSLISFIKFTSEIKNQSFLADPILPFLAHLILAYNSAKINLVLVKYPEIFKELFSIILLKTETTDVSQGYFLAIFRNLLAGENVLFAQNRDIIKLNYKQLILPMAYNFTVANCECLKIFLGSEDDTLKPTQSNTLLALLLNFSSERILTKDDFQTEIYNFRSLFNFLNKRQIIFEPKFLAVNFFSNQNSKKQFSEFQKIQIKMIFLKYLASCSLITKCDHAVELLETHKRFQSDSRRMFLLYDILDFFSVLWEIIDFGSMIPEQFPVSLLEILATYPKCDSLHAKVVSLLQKIAPTFCKDHFFFKQVKIFVLENFKLSQKCSKNDCLSISVLLKIYDTFVPEFANAESPISGMELGLINYKKSLHNLETKNFELKKVESVNVCETNSIQDIEFEDIFAIKYRNLEFKDVTDDLKLDSTIPLLFNRKFSTIKNGLGARKSAKSCGLSESFVIRTLVEGQNEKRIEISFEESGSTFTNSELEESLDDERFKRPLMDSFEQITMKKRGE